MVIILANEKSLSLSHLNQNPVPRLAGRGRERIGTRVGCVRVQRVGILNSHFSFSLQESRCIIGKIANQEIGGTSLEMCLVGLRSTAQSIL